METGLMRAIDSGDDANALALINRKEYIEMANKMGETALMKAALRGNDKIAQALIESGADVNIADRNGKTALMKAIYCGLDEIVLQLIKSGADVNIADINGETALMKAVDHRKNGIALELIENGADVNIANMNHETALMKAVYLGLGEITLQLIKSGADVNIVDMNHETALMTAVYGLGEITLQLIKSGADVNIVDMNGETALMKAVCVYPIADGLGEIVSQLIKSGADVNIADKHGKTALMNAARCGLGEIASQLIKSGADANIANKNGETALMITVYLWRVETASQLIKSGADINIADKHGHTALIQAVFVERGEIVSQLIKSGADVNIADKNGVTALIIAVRFKLDEIAIQLIKSGADLNIVDKNGETTLMRAVYRGFGEIASQLIKSGADVNIADKIGETVLIKAVYCGLGEIASQLIKSGADVNIADKNGETALMKAAYSGLGEIASQLIKSGANVNIANKNGQTALMIAVFCRRGEIASQLIKSGADVNIANKNGKTALMNAVRFQLGEIAIQLIKSGADVNITDEDGETALIKAACSYGSNNIALQLIKSGANVNIANKNGETALMRAVCCGLGEIASQLIKSGADVNIANKNGEIALIKAIYHKRGEIALQLIKSGSDVNIADKNGETALMKAFHQFDCDEIALQLIKSGADVNIVDKNRDETALMKAAYCPDVRIALELIKSGVDLNLADEDGKTALMKAVDFQNDQIALQLIQSGADVNMADKNGETALMKAGEYSTGEIALQLIKSGADINMIDCKGNSPLMHAVKNENLISALLQERKVLVNTTNCNGRSPLFYAILERNNSARYILDHGGNLNLTDNFNVSILSFFIHDCISKKIMPSQIHQVLNLFKEKGVEEQAVLQAIINAVFCKIPLYISSFITSDNLFPMMQVAVDLVEEGNVQMKNGIQKIINSIKEKTIASCDLLDILSLLSDLGANPNTADENGNTALHNIIWWSLNNSNTNVLDIFHELEKFGLASIKKNCSQETPLLHFLSSALELVQTRLLIPGIGQMIEVCKFLLKDPSSINETSRSGKSVFHLIIQLFQEGLDYLGVINRTDTLIFREDLHFQDGGQEILLTKTLQLLKLFSPRRVNIAVTVNKADDQMCSPLHYWASLPVHVPLPIGFSFEDLQGTISEHLLSCGAKVNARNQKDETPLHLCKTWHALNLLVKAGANINDVDMARRPPLLVAAQNRLFLEKRDHFYPDVTEDLPTFWRITIDMGFDLWACDKDGNSIISNLIESEAFVLAKALVEVACDESRNKSDEASVCVVNAICKDCSIRTTWKPILVQMVLNSKRRPLDLSAFLRLCCTNIIDHEDTSKAEDKTTDGSTKEINEDISSERGNSATSLSVHWEVAKLLLRYGADGKYCLDLADSYPAIKDLLTKPLSIDEVPMVIPWTSYSSTHEEKLARVARRQNCKSVEAYWYQEEYIACGTFGHVFAGINENDGREVAIKRIETLRLVRPRDVREIQTFLALSDCKQVVQYLAFYGWEDFSYIVLELMEGNLDDYFGSAVYDQAQNTILSKDVVMGLKYLHDHKIIHRDVKPSNILYKTHPNLCLKIADFGLSRRVDVTSSLSVMGTNAGTRAWIAPEVVKSLLDQKHTMSSDIFCCGLLLHYIVSPKRHPFDPANRTGKSASETCTERENNMLNNKMDGWDNSLVPEVSDLVKRMLDGDENKRPPASQVLDHPMFWSDKKKMDLLSAVGNQPEFEWPRSKRPKPAWTAVEVDLEAVATSIIHPHPKWDDARYTEMAKIFVEMSKPFIKGKLTIYPRKCKTGSVVDLVRFIRNAMAHVSESSRPSPIRKLIISEFAFLKEFPNLVMEVYNVVTKHGWDSKEEIEHVIRN